MSADAPSARRIIRTLRAGIVSCESAVRIKTATAEVEAELAKVLDAFAGTDGRPTPLLLEGDWGSGKTHMKMLLRHELRRRRIPHVVASVGRYQGSLAHLHLTVPRWLATLDFGDACGLRAALECGLVSENATREWAMASESALARGLQWALAGRPEGWLLALGHCYSVPSHSYQHRKALDLVLSVGQFVSAVGYCGVVLLLDEIENVCLQHDVRGRRRSYDTLFRLWHGGDFLPIMFVTNRFVSQVHEDRRSGAQSGWRGWTSQARDFVESAVRLRRMRPPVIGLSAARELVRHIVAVYVEANGPSSFAMSENEILDAWMRTTTRSIRLLVRLTVGSLDTAAGASIVQRGLPC